MRSVSQGAGSHQTQPAAGALFLGFPAFGTVRNKFLLFVSHLVYDILL